MRLFAAGIVLSVSLAEGTPLCVAADMWGGSIGITNDYLVRGVSRSDGQAALQFDLHYLNASGVVAGLFASNAKIDHGDPSTVELDGFLGFAWTAGSDWRGKALASHYAYPGSRVGAGYDYDEIDVDAAFQDWVSAALIYSPNAPRYVPYRGWAHTGSESAEVNLQRPMWRKLSAIGGVGYSQFDGADAAGYGYWSVGAAYDLAPVSLTASYVNTTAGAKTLFYNAAEGKRWTGTIIWRF